MVSYDIITVRYGEYLIQDVFLDGIEVRDSSQIPEGISRRLKSVMDYCNREMRRRPGTNILVGEGELN